jgi:DNA-binding transcriptional MocR family regulator
MLLMTLDRTSRVPIYRQIYERVARLIDEGTLTPGAAIPASRNPAGTLGVNRSTVVRAYQELWALGYLEARPGSYTIVRGRTKALTGATPKRGGLVDWGKVSAPPARQAHRERFMQMCEAHRVPILEDGFEEEMKYFGKCVLPLKSMDAGGIVIYAGTFSKVVFPGLRLGWIAAERECIERLLAISRFSTLSANTLAQAAVHRFCETGCYEDHLRRIHRAYRKRMSALLQGLKRHLPEQGVSWTQPLGGYTLWLSVEGTALDEAEFDTRLRQAGVVASRGSLFFSSESRGVHFRISVANLSEDEIEEGCRKLGRVLARAVRESGFTPGERGGLGGLESCRRQDGPPEHGDG